MQTITPLTSEATESTLNRSDTQQPTMSLGGGGAQMQSVTGSGVKEPKEDPRANMSEEELKAMYAGQEAARYPEKEKEKEQLTDTKEEQTHGEKAQTVEDINKNSEKWNDYINKGKFDWYDFLTNVNDKEWKQFESYLKNNNINIKDYNLNKQGDTKQLLNGFISHLLGNYKNELHEIKTDPSYDNRTDEQIRNDKLLEEQRQRDDTAHQRMVDDMRAAGLNPAAFKGANYGGGGGGGSGSRDDDEEEKRKRRRREKFEQERAKKAEKMRQMELVTGIVTNLMGTATKGIGAGAYMANQNKLAQANQAHQKEMQQSANIHNRYMIEAEKLAGNKKYRKGEDW